MSKISEIVILSVCLFHHLFLLLYKKEKKEDYIKLAAVSLYFTIVLDFDSFISKCWRSYLLFLVYFQAQYTITLHVDIERAWSTLPYSVIAGCQTTIYVCRDRFLLRFHFFRNTSSRKLILA